MHLHPCTHRCRHMLPHTQTQARTCTALSQTMHVHLLVHVCTQGHASCTHSDVYRVCTNTLVCLHGHTLAFRETPGALQTKEGLGQLTSLLLVSVRTQQSETRETPGLPSDPRAHPAQLWPRDTKVSKSFMLSLPWGVHTTPTQTYCKHCQNTLSKVPLGGLL